MQQNIQQLLDQITHHETQMAYHRSEAEKLRNQYLARTWEDGVDYGNGLLKRRPTKSHGRWVAWLRDNGPTPRATVADACGLLLGEPPPYLDQMGLTQRDIQDGKYPDDFMLRIQAENPQGKGRPIDVYFTWGQRFDVRPIYGVGPESIELTPIQGVVQPVEVEPPDDIRWDEPFVPDPPKGSDGEYLTLEEWMDLNVAGFDKVRAGVKPDDNDRAQMRATLPDGFNLQLVNEAIHLVSVGRLDNLVWPSP